MTQTKISVAGENTFRPTKITDTPIDDLIKWHEAEEQVCLITLTGVDGAAPRAVGAQMVVANSGKSAGYLSGGCLEQALILEALDAMQTRQNKRLRYGKGSPFIDIKLPCESGLDIYIDQNLQPELIGELRQYHRARKPFVLKTNTVTGTSSIIPSLNSSLDPKSYLADDEFYRAYTPQTRVLLFGASPTAERLAALTQELDLPLEYFTPDETRATQNTRTTLHKLNTPSAQKEIATDPWSAAILAFHDHDWEIPILEKLLHSECFYIGAIGNKKVAEQRREALRSRNIDEEKLKKLQNCAGLIPGAKDANSLALGILTEILKNRAERAQMS